MKVNLHRKSRVGVTSFYADDIEIERACARSLSV